VRQMCQNKVGSALVMKEKKIVGIFTERDVLSRIVDAERDPKKTPVSEVMSHRVTVMSPKNTIREAMAVMTEQRCRHLPVIDGAQILGLISIGDCTRWAIKDQHFKIAQLVNYITGQYPA